MKPWQAKWYELKRLNPSREVIACVAILLGCALVFFFMPSAKQARLVKNEAKLELYVNGKKGRLATEAEIKSVTQTHNFLIRKIADAPTLYIFVPSLNINLAVLGRLRKVTPGIDGYTVWLVPRSDRDSPTTEKAVGLCLLPDMGWKVADLIRASPNIAASKSHLDQLWSNVSTADQSKIKTMMEENEAVQRKLGSLTALVVVGRRGYLFEDYFYLSEFRDRLSELQMVKP